MKKRKSEVNPRAVLRQKKNPQTPTIKGYTGLVSVADHLRAKSLAMLGCAPKCRLRA